MGKFKHFLVILVFGLAGCSSLGGWFGDAETPGQKAFRSAGEYVYTAIPMRNYLGHPNASAGLAAGLCAINESVYQATQAAINSAMAGADDTSIRLLQAGSALASFNLAVFSQADLPENVMDVTNRSLVIATVGLMSAGEMRVWRKGYLHPKLEFMVANGSDPSEEDWDEINTRMSDIYNAITTQCEAIQTSINVQHTLKTLVAAKWRGLVVNLPGSVG